MTEDETRKLAETLESIAIAEAMELLIRHTEGNGPGDERQIAMLLFFRSLLNKYRRRTLNVRITKDRYGEVTGIVDETLLRYGTN